MEFPGFRNPKNYFPVGKKATTVGDESSLAKRRWSLLGLDQVIVDMVVHGAEHYVNDLKLTVGESVPLSQAQFQDLLARIEREQIPCSFAAGGTVANTLNNYTFLSREPAVLLGAIESAIQPGSPAFAYVAQTPKALDLGQLVSVAGSIGTAITFVSATGERSFAVAPGVSNDFSPSAVSPDIVSQAAVVLTCLYCLRDPDWPIAKAALRLMSLARQNDVPVAFGLGTAGLVRAMAPQVREILREYVTIVAMNADEAEALTGERDAFLACRAALELVDLAVVTEGPGGMTVGGYTDEDTKRQTEEKIRSKSIPEYNRWEYSRLMRRADCARPLQIFSHIHPYHGGPDRLRNTSGAGDAALAAILHDIAANRFHRAKVPESDKHVSGTRFLTYSSLSRNAQYGNRVAYEVLKGRSPRLDRPVGPDED